MIGTICCGEACRHWTSARESAQVMCPCVDVRFWLSRSANHWHALATRCSLAKRGPCSPRCNHLDRQSSRVSAFVKARWSVKVSRNGRMYVLHAPSQNSPFILISLRAESGPPGALPPLGLERIPISPFLNPAFVPFHLPCFDLHSILLV